MRWHRLVALLLILTGCGDDSQATLVIDLRTDFVGGVDFDGVRVFVGNGDLRAGYEHVYTPLGDYFRGQRVATHSDDTPGEIPVEVQLVRSGSVVISRSVIATLGAGRTVATVVITRNCESVECPSPTGSPQFVSCVNGACADLRCTLETPEFCPVSTECAATPDCPTVGCQRAECLSGFCFTGTDNRLCNAAQMCRRDGECVDARSDGGFGDADARDASVDGPLDAVMDAFDGGTQPPSVVTTCWQRPLACNWNVPFELVEDDGTTLAGLQSSTPTNFAFSPDGCELMFLSFVPSRLLYVSRRAGPSAAFLAPTVVQGVNGTAAADKGTISPSGLELIHTNQFPPNIFTALAYRSTRPDFATEWSAGILVDVLNVPDFKTFDASFAPHGLRIYLVHDDDVLPPTIEVAARASLDDPFSAPVVIADASDEFMTGEPSVTADERVLTFVASAVAEGPRQFRYATRNDWNDPWVQQATIRAPYLDGGAEAEAIVSPDGCELLVVRPSMPRTRLMYRAL